MLALAIPAQTAQAQGLFNRVDVEAYAGAPFGVARVTVPLGGAPADALLAVNGIALEDAEGRALYPVMVRGRVAEFLNNVAGEQGGLIPPSVQIFFLFKGNTPFTATVYTPQAVQVEVVPRAGNPRAMSRQYDRLMNRWWREYNGMAEGLGEEGDYRPLVETYLTTMLGARLGLAPPPRQRRAEERAATQPEKTFDLLAATEPHRAQLMRDMMRAPWPEETASLPMPAPIRWRERPITAPPGEVVIEPIARFVPEECFYVRFGKYSHYLWLSDLLDEYGGDISRMVTLRGHNARVNQRIQDRLALKKTSLSKLFGDQVIADVALIGRDLFMQEGPAMGVLFQARNAPLLNREFTQQRQAALREWKEAGATLEEIEIAGRKVTLLSTPDNRLRSFYAIESDFHLVTTSRAIVERFFEAAEGKRALANSAEFRAARMQMPDDRQDTIFVYLSQPFFQGLVSPQYRIELARRLRSVAEMELLQLARLTARGEGSKAHSVEELIAAGFLPPRFGRRADGSRLIAEGDVYLDSLRGARGSFLPIADAPIQGVTRDEAADYAELAAFGAQNWPEMDPVVAGVRRTALNREGLERVVIDAMVTPFSPGKYGSYLERLGPPSTRYVRGPETDEVFLQAVLRGGGADPQLGAHHLFVGMKDAEPLFDPSARQGFLSTLQLIRGAPAYLGAWPKPGYVDMLPFGLAGQPDEFGYSQLPFGLWRRQWGDWSALSFYPEILAEASENLTFAEDSEPAQIRLRVGDLSNAQLAGYFHRLAYSRAGQASVGNARLLHALSQQLRLPREEALAAAQQLLGVELVCALGGEYKLIEYKNGLLQWTSTAWKNGRPDAFSDDFRAPAMEWFRGLNARVNTRGDSLMLHAELDMQRKPNESPAELPLFDLLKGLGGGKATGPEAEEPPPEEVPRRPQTGPREF